MSKHTISHACGHDVVTTLTGNKNDRARRERYLETTLCSECYRAKSIADSKAAAAAATTAVGKLWTLPALTGSERQVSWANDLRITALAKLEAHMKENFDGLQYLSLHGLVQGEIDRCASASWWIDRRNYPAGARALLLAAVLRTVESAADVEIMDSPDGKITYVRGLPLRDQHYLEEGTRDGARGLLGGETYDRLTDMLVEVRHAAREAQRAARVAS